MIMTGRLVDGSPFTSHSPTSRRVPLATARVLVPLVPPNFYALGLNVEVENDAIGRWRNPVARES